LFGDLSGTLSRIQHHSAYFNGLHLGVLNREIQSNPRRKLGWLLACYFVCECNSVDESEPKYDEVISLFDSLIVLNSQDLKSDFFDNRLEGSLRGEI